MAVDAVGMLLLNSSSPRHRRGFAVNSDRPGRSFHGEFSSADASALSEPNSRFSLFWTGKTSPLVLSRNDRVIVDSISVVAGVALTVTLYDGPDATVSAGETIMKGNFGANGGISISPDRQCAKQSYPKVKTSGAGQIDCIISGRVVYAADFED